MSESNTQMQNTSEGNSSTPKVQRKRQHNVNNDEQTDLQLMVTGVNKRFKPAELKQILQDTHKIAGLSRVRKVPGQNHCYLTFESGEYKEQARDILQNVENENTKQKWNVKNVGKRNPHKRKNKDKGKNKKIKLTNVADQIAPLHRVPYEKQLEDKCEARRKQFCDVMISTLNKKWKYNVPPHLKLENGGLEWCGILGSPVVNGYRNKNEMTVGELVSSAPQDGSTEAKKTSRERFGVGFLMGLFSEGQLTIGEPSDCPNVSDIAKTVSALFTDFLQHQDDMLPYEKVNHTGFWRLVLTRENTDGEVMIVVQANPTGVEENKLNEIRQRMTVYLVSETAKRGINMKSLYLQYWGGVSNRAPNDCPYTHLWGEKYIYETISGLRFRVSPDSFLQVNTRGAEVLYAKTREWCGLQDIQTDTETSSNANKPSDIVLLDICCGTGTIGLSMANAVSRVVGIEMVKSAVEDAKLNAQLNGVKNAEFVCGKVEDVLPGVLANLKPTEKCVAVLDPPRGGLHKHVLHALVTCNKIARLVYVSCNPDSLLDNAIYLCRPKKGCYKPVKAVAMDMFPHTEHCEMIMALEKCSKDIDEHIRANI